MNQSVSKNHPRSAPLVRGKQTPLQITAPALRTRTEPWPVSKYQVLQCWEGQQRPKPQGPPPRYLLQYSQAIVGGTCSPLLALCLKLEDSMSGTMGRYLLSWGRHMNRTYLDITGQQIGFREFLLEVFSFETQNHCKVRAVIAPPIQQSLRTKAGGIPTFPTLQRHQVTVIVKWCDDNVHKIELTLMRKQ